MTVKRSRSAARVLAVLEGIARHQPIGVSELARVLNDDKSAVQRAIMTLADTGWIATTGDTPKRWQVTAHILTIAHAVHSGGDLVTRAKPVLEALRREVGETVLLTVPDIRNFVVVEVLESRYLLRTVPHVGMIIPVRGSSTSRAILPYLQREQQIELLGKPPDDVMMEHFSRTLKNGYAVSDGDVVDGSTNIAAPVFELGGRPVAAIVVSGPSDRIGAREHERIGRIVYQAARSISRDAPAAVSPEHEPA